MLPQIPLGRQGAPPPIPTGALLHGTCLSWQVWGCPFPGRGPGAWKATAHCLSSQSPAAIPENLLEFSKFRKRLPKWNWTSCH